MPLNRGYFTYIKTVKVNKQTNEHNNMMYNQAKSTVSLADA